MADFSQRLHAAVRAKQTPALVGLDPRYERLPPPVVAAAENRSFADHSETIASAFEEFCGRIIDVVAPLVPAVKPQAAFFEEIGPAGLQALVRVIRKARDAGLVVICDAKRGDIGSTADAYARGFLAGEDPRGAPWGADALTVNPYLGPDTLEPFVQVARERSAGIYVLVRTSNAGAGVFQDRLAAPEGWQGSNEVSPERDRLGVRGAQPQPPPLPFYRHVAAAVEQLAAETAAGGEYGCVGAVVGATAPQELAELREAMPHAPLLIPGYGSQGGTSADVAGGFRFDGLGALVNNSRGINFAFSLEPYSGQFAPAEWERAVEAATKAMIADLAAHTPAGALRQS